MKTLNKQINARCSRNKTEKERIIWRTRRAKYFACDRVYDLSVAARDLKPVPARYSPGHRSTETTPRSKCSKAAPLSRISEIPVNKKKSAKERHHPRQPETYGPPSCSRFPCGDPNKNIALTQQGRGCFEQIDRCFALSCDSSGLARHTFSWFRAHGEAKTTK